MQIISLQTVGFRSSISNLHFMTFIFHICFEEFGLFNFNVWKGKVIFRLPNSLIVTQFPGVSDILHVDNSLGVLVPADCSHIPAGRDVRGGVPRECLWSQEFKRNGAFCPCQEEARHGRPQLFRSASDGPHRNIRTYCSSFMSLMINFLYILNLLLLLS